MALKFFHVGIPVTQVRPDMYHAEAFGVWATWPDDFALKIEYIYYEDNTIFPDILRTQVHTAYYVDDLDLYLPEADEVLLPPTPAGKDRVAFIMKDGAIFELYEKKKLFAPKG